jgi:hypothetical protein
MQSILKTDKSYLTLPQVSILYSARGEEERNNNTKKKITRKNQLTQNALTSSLDEKEYHG